MRIISGTAKGRRLASFSGKAIRPTSDRVREALFSILISRRGSLHGSRVLDLFAGTGAMGIEALSRGAGRAVLVDQSGEAVRLITANLKTCRLEEGAAVIRSALPAALPRLREEAPFDLIFLDPPYDLGLAEKALKAIAEERLLAPEGFVVAETSRSENLPEEIHPLVLEERRLYGAAAIHLYFNAPESAAP